MTITTRTLIPATVALAALVGLVGCDRRTDDDRTAGQKLDSAISAAGQKTDQAAATVKDEMDKAKAAGERAADATGSTIKDATITAGINAELMRDPALSALKIDVDTNAGRVVLRGAAPDAAAHDRAGTLAHKVDGVVSVDNQLAIRN